jgi:hypothetical protein
LPKNILGTQVGRIHEHKKWKATSIGVYMLSQLSILAPALYEAGARGLIGPVGNPAFGGLKAVTLQSALSAEPDVGGEFGPIFVLGLPRSGTSLLQRLLALDEGARTPLNWEWKTPSSIGNGGQKEARFERARTFEAMDGRVKATSILHPRYHELLPEHPAEDQQLFNLFGLPIQELALGGTGTGGEPQIERKWLEWGIEDFDPETGYRIHKAHGPTP